jgi:8-oxo-dGTP pyrophosphatase MutT (NUDIX family)
MKSWKETGARTLISTSVFALQERRSISPRTGEEIPFFVLESGPWVNVVPLTDDGRVVMVRQYRQGTRTVTLEIPGGVLEPGESPEDGARRELLEETGYEAAKWEVLGLVHPNPAIQDNVQHTYLATGLRKVSDGDPDPAEDIEVLELDLDEVEALIRRGEVTHSLVIAAFYWLHQRLDLRRQLERALEELGQAQLERVAALAKRINSRLTPDDLLSPQDFPELANDPDFHYQDGMLTGIESARAAVRRLLRRPVLD